MNKFLTNQFGKGPNNSLYLSDRSNFAFRGKWIGVQYNTIMDKWHLGDFKSAHYQISVEYGSNEAETMQISVIARPDRAVVNIYGRSSINQELINISATVDASVVYLNVEPKSASYAGAKLIFHASYAQSINKLSPPAIVADTSTAPSSGINTFDSLDNKFDATNITFDKV